MAFRNPLTSLGSLDLGTATGILDGSHLAAGTVTADHVVAGAIDGQVITAATLETAYAGTPRIIIGADAYNAGAPAVLWDTAGIGADWTRPYILVDPATNVMKIVGRYTGPAVGWLELFPNGDIQIHATSMSGPSADLYLSAAAGTVTSSGPIIAPNLAAIQRGTFAITTIASGGSASGSVAFPANFGYPPTSVVLCTDSGRLTTSCSTFTSAGFHWSINNWSPAASGNDVVYWVAVF